MSTESQELYLFAVNDSGLYRQRILPIIANLKKKIAKGVYDPTLALKLWKYAADDAAQRYTKEFDNGRGYGIFTPTMRRETAKELQDYYEEHLREKTNPRRGMLAAHARAVSVKRNPKRKTTKKKFYTPSEARRVFDAYAAQRQAEHEAHLAKHGSEWNRTHHPKKNPRSVDCVVLKGATTGKVYARLLNSTTTMADMKAMAQAIAARYEEAVTATRVRVTP